MSRISQLLFKFIDYLYFLLMTGIVFLCLFVSFINYPCKQFFLVPESVLLILALLVCIILFKVYKKRDVFKKGRSFPILKISLLLLLLQLFIYYNIYFKSGWDVSSILEASVLIAKSTPPGSAWDWSNYYFSIYPNNSVIICIFAFILRLNSNWSENLQQGIFVIIILQSVLSTATGYLLYKIIEEITLNNKYAIYGFVCYSVICTLGGWASITYSDAWAIIFPVGMIRLYQHISKSDKKMLLWIELISITYIGYRIKPTVFLVFVAIVMTIFLKNIDHIKTKWKDIVTNFIKIGALSLFLVFVLSNLFSFMIKSTGLSINPESNIGMIHYVKMGMHPTEHGVYNDEDVFFSMAIEKKEERDLQNLEIIKERLNAYTPVSFSKHLAKKTLCVFNDAGFGWGVYGSFYDEIYDNKIPGVSSFLRSIYYNDGKYYKINACIRQAFWLLILFFSLFAPFYKGNHEKSIIIISLIGIILFEAIFEANSRLLYSYIPIFIISSAIGFNKVGLLIKDK